MDFKANMREKVIDLVAEEQTAANQSKLLTPAAIRQRIALEIDESIKQYSGRMTRGYRLLAEIYEKRKNEANEAEPLVIPFLEPGFFENREAVWDELIATEGEINMREAFNIEEQGLWQAHDLTIPLFEAKNYQDAADILFYLTNIASDLADLLTSLAQAEYYCGHPEAAINCYSAAFICDETNAKPLIYAAHCLIEIGHKEEARTFLDHAAQVAQEQGAGELSHQVEVLRRCA